jgi:hypothetical protein
MRLVERDESIDRNTAVTRSPVMSETGGHTPRAWTAWPVVLIGLLGLVIGAYSAASQLRLHDWDPAGMIGVGVLDEPRIEYAEELFGREIPLRSTVGHDGRFFLIQAMDPLFVSPEEHAHLLDRPTYRSQRMLYPTLAGLARPFFGPDGVAWAMAGLNVLAFGVGAAATAVVARRHGVSAVWGLAFPFNPGVLFELHIDGGGALAFAGVMVGIALVRRRDTWPAAVALTAAVLAREVMLVCVLGIALARGVGALRRRVALFAVPLATAAVWRIYVEVRLGALPSGETVQEIGLPFRGFALALERWMQDPDLSMALGVFYLFAALVVIFRSLRRWTVLELPAAGIAVLAPLLTQFVWLQFFDISRALIPIPTLLALSLAASIFGSSAAASSGRDSARALSHGPSPNV